MDQNKDNDLFNFDNPPPQPPQSEPSEPSEPVQEPGGAQVYEVPPTYQPAEPLPYIPPPSQPPVKKNRTWLIVIIVVLVLCCCCLAFLAFMYFYAGDEILRQIENSSIPLMMQFV